MATKTANSGGGNASAGGTWVGGVAPVTGDVIVIPSNNPVTEVVWDSPMNAVILGANGSNVGDAFTINGTNATTYGKLRVPSGSILQTRGNGTTSNTAGLVNQYGQLVFESGAQYTGDPSGDWTTVILNKGHIFADGCLFTSTSGCYSWGNSVTAVSQVSGLADWRYNYSANIGGFPLNDRWIANAAGTALGSFGDSSLSFTGSPSPTLTTEVASIAAVTSVGKYYVDYELGVVYAYMTANPTVSASYKYLAITKSWSIQTAQNTIANSATFSNCIFEYMGAVTESNGTKGTLHFANRQSDGYSGSSGNSSRKFAVTGSTFRYCSHGISILSSNGTSGDPLAITGNTFGECKGDSIGSCIYLFRSSTSYINASNNTIKSRSSWLWTASNAAFIEHTGWTIDSNTAIAASYFIASNSIHEGGSLNRVCFPDSVLSNNTILGVGRCVDGYLIAGFCGKSGHNAIMRNNRLAYSKRAVALGPYLTSYSNQISDCLHHHVIGPATAEDSYIADVYWYNNAHWGNNDNGGFQFGYNRRMWMDNVWVHNNTFNGGGVEFGDAPDNSGLSLISRAYVFNNVVVNSAAGGLGAYSKPTDTTGYRTRAQITRFDHCSAYNSTPSHYTGINGPATFTKSGTRYNEDGTRNCLGITLQDPSYSTDQASGRTLAYTINSAGTDETLSWDGGTAVQAILYNRLGTTSVDAINTFLDAGQSFGTTKNGATSPFACWLKILSGPMSGTVRAITNVQSSTKLTIAPIWPQGYISAATNASPIVVTSTTAHGFSTGQRVFISGVTGNTAANGSFNITVVDSTRFSLDSSTGNGAYTGNPGNWSAIPGPSDSYAIYKPEIRLTDSGGSQYVTAGLDPRYLPGSSKSDTGITITLGRIETDPKLSAGSTSNDLTSVDQMKFTAGSSAADAGTSDNAPATDYYGTTRPQGGSIDLGFYEAIVTIPKSDGGIWEAGFTSFTGGYSG